MSDKQINENLVNQEVENLQEDITSQEIMEAVESLDDYLTNIFLSEKMISFLDEVRAENYNKLSKKERMIKFGEIVNYLNKVLTNDIIKDTLAIIETPVEGEFIDIFENGVIFIYGDIFKYKNNGIGILTKIVSKVRQYMIEVLIDQAFQSSNKNIYKELKGVTKEYYDNLTLSIFDNSWNNKLSKDDNKYYLQPVVFDSTRLEMEILFEYLKILYAKYQIIDTEMSSLLYNSMNFSSKLNEYKKTRKEIVKKNKENTKLHLKEQELAKEYFKITLSDLSKLSDDEFYGLFNSCYYPILNTNYDEKMPIRMKKMVNELMQREFREFDLTNVDLPKYDFDFDSTNYVMNFKKEYGGKVEESNPSHSGEIFSEVLVDITEVAQVNNLFKFNSDEEKENYFIMKEWLKLKNHDFSDPCDKEVVSDGLNIVLQKVTEILANIEKKVENAIANSSIDFKGRSLLRYDNKDAYYDYHEFKNGRSRKEVCDGLMDYMKLDIENMKKKGGR